MEVKDILAELDREISRLQQARALLAGDVVKKTATTRKKYATAAAAAEPARRKLSPEGRKRIAEAMKRRWAERKKQASSKPGK